ncbi:MAG: protease modulator HflC, partial [Sphingomonas sp.]
VSSTVIVRETQQAVVLRFEQPVATINAWRPGQPFGSTDAGLHFRIPFFDRVVWVDKRVLDVDLDNQPVLSANQDRLDVDAYARYRIVDPLRAVVATGSTGDTERRVSDQLAPLLGSALRNELGKRQFSELLSPERGIVMHNIQAGLQAKASEYGVRIVDVRIRQAELPEGSPRQSALARMRSARQQQAATIRAQGLKEAQIIQAEADAQASRIYAESFGKDPKFYDFYRAMQSYRTTFGADGSSPSGETNIILSPNSDYLRQFEGRQR